MAGDLIKIDLSIIGSGDKKLIKELIELNPYSRSNGLVITEEIAREITEARHTALKNNGRVELKTDVTARLVRAFSESPYIFQEDFSFVIAEIIDLFYHIKNETENSISDDDLISEMRNVFNNTCHGDIENMQSKGLEKIVRKFKWNDDSIWDNSVSSGENTYHDINREEMIGYEEKWRE